MTDDAIIEESKEEFSLGLTASLFLKAKNEEEKYGILLYNVEKTIEKSLALKQAKIEKEIEELKQEVEKCMEEDEKNEQVLENASQIKMADKILTKIKGDEKFKCKKCGSKRWTIYRSSTICKDCGEEYIEEEK